MKNVITTLVLFCMLMCSAHINAQQQNEIQAAGGTAEEPSKELPGFWFKYFNGEYSDIDARYNRFGYGTSTFPVNYNTAMRLEAGDKRVSSRAIKKFSFVFGNLDYIENIKVWMSTTLPQTADKADICCYALDKASVLIGKPTEFEFPIPYKFGTEDVYIGYEFTLTDEKDICPVVIDKNGAVTNPNAFILSFNNGTWKDNKGLEYGNPAIAVYLEETKDKGDVNHDGRVDVLDATITIDYVLTGKSDVMSMFKADVDDNGNVNIVDVESIIDILLGLYKAPTKNMNGYDSDMLMAEKTGHGVSVRLDSENKYRGFQMDVVLPEGADMKGIDLDASLKATHNVRYMRVDGSRYRIVVTSVNGTDINAESLVSIVSSSDNIKIENIIFATSDLQEKHFDRITAGDVTSVENAEEEKHQSVMYNLNGMKVNSKNPDKGVYIVNGKKIVVK